jgi:hypothetical protein
LFLSEHTGDACPDTLIYLLLRDADAIAEEFGAAVEQMPRGRRSGSVTRTATGCGSACQHLTDRTRKSAAHDGGEQLRRLPVPRWASSASR